jgi:aminoglycoside phosphotransferase (APT) family kinase protein
MQKPGEPEDSIRAFVQRSGLVFGTESFCFTALTGGVASDIWKITAGTRSFVVKKALARLRVAGDWRAPVSRNATEVEWLTTAAQIVPEAVPRVLFHDPAAGAFVMEYLDPSVCPVWKAELRDGRVDPAFASAVGHRLAAIHNATAGEPAVAGRFADDALFHAIRLEPYFEATAARHPDLGDALFALSRETLATRRALVHGDVSPKNILVGPHSPIFLDAECAWYGDPAFDLAFCLNHLLLKGVLRPDRRPALAASFTALQESYLAMAAYEARDVVEARAARLLPALLLARVDGKSPVEYVTAETEKDRIRRVARPLAGLSAIAARWAEEFPE